MGLSEWRQMRNLEKEAVDIRKTLRENRHTPASGKHLVKHGRDEYGRKTYGNVKGKHTDPTPTKADDARRIKEAKKVEARIKAEKKAAEQERKRIAAEAKKIADQARKAAKERLKADREARRRR